MGAVTPKMIDFDEASIIPFNDLEPSWHVPGATEGGFLRWLVSWVGGPAGYINPSFGRSIISENMSVGFMRLMAGCRQRGVHSHTVTEIYIILKGEIEGVDGLGHKHHAGPMDCVYIPEGVPHGIRNSGREDLDLIWLHDGIEKKGLSTYYYSEAETPRIGGVSVLKFNSLEPHWGAPCATSAPFLRYAVSFVAGQNGCINLNPFHAEINDNIALGILVIYPGNKQVPHSISCGQCYVVIRGKGILRRKGGVRTVQSLDGIWISAGTTLAIENQGEDPLWMMWVHDRPQKISSVAYLES